MTSMDKQKELRQQYNKFIPPTQLSGLNTCDKAKHQTTVRTCEAAATSHLLENFFLKSQQIDQLAISINRDQQLNCSCQSVTH